MSIRRQDIVSAIKTRLQTITTTGGYHTNIGNNVFVWRVADVTATSLPCIVIRDASNVFELEEASALGKHTQLLNVDLDVICSSATTSDQTVKQMIADVYKAIGTDETWGGKAFASRPLSDEIIVDQQDKTIGGATIKIEILWRTDRWQES